jgi:hypothetical protein
MKWKEWSRVASDEALWQDHEEKGLLKAECLRDYVLRLWFEESAGATVYELDFYPLIVEEDPGEAFRPLRNLERFRQVVGDYALIWPDPDTGAYDSQAVDLAPECVRFFCEKYGKKLRSSKRATSDKHPVKKRCRAVVSG